MLGPKISAIDVYSNLRKGGVGPILRVGLHENTYSSFILFHSAFAAESADTETEVDSMMEPYRKEFVD